MVPRGAHQLSIGPSVVSGCLSAWMSTRTNGTRAIPRSPQDTLRDRFRERAACPESAVMGAGAAPSIGVYPPLLCRSRPITPGVYRSRVSPLPSGSGSVLQSGEPPTVASKRAPLQTPGTKAFERAALCVFKTTQVRRHGDSPPGFRLLFRAPNNPREAHLLVEAEHCQPEMSCFGRRGSGPPR